MTGKRARLFRDDLANARLLCRRPTEAERQMWRLLRDRQFLNAKFRRQHPIGPYVVDFFCAEAGRVVELDGGGHATEEKVADDEHREREIAQPGYRVLRFWNSDVLQNPSGVQKRIAEALGAPSP